MTNTNLVSLSHLKSFPVFPLNVGTKLSTPTLTSTALLGPAPPTGPSSQPHIAPLPSLGPSLTFLKHLCLLLRQSHCTHHASAWPTPAHAQGPGAGSLPGGRPPDGPSNLHGCTHCFFHRALIQCGLRIDLAWRRPLGLQGIQGTSEDSWAAPSQKEGPESPPLVQGTEARDGDLRTNSSNHE